MRGSPSAAKNKRSKEQVDLRKATSRNCQAIAGRRIGVTIIAADRRWFSDPHSGAGDESGLSFSTTYVTAIFIGFSPVRAECGISGGI